MAHFVKKLGQGKKYGFPYQQALLKPSIIWPLFREGNSEGNIEESKRREIVKSNNRIIQKSKS